MVHASWDPPPGRLRLTPQSLGRKLTTAALERSVLQRSETLPPMAPGRGGPLKWSCSFNQYHMTFVAGRVSFGGCGVRVSGFCIFFKANIKRRVSGRPLVRIVMVALAVGFGLRSSVCGLIGQVCVEIGGVNSREPRFRCKSRCKLPGCSLDVQIRLGFEPLVITVLSGNLRAPNQLSCNQSESSGSDLLVFQCWSFF